MKSIMLTVWLVLLWVAVAIAAVNINSADQQALESLPGIGAVKAEAIIKYREEHGKFKSVDELTEVKGIGQKSLENIREMVEAGN
jgi:competence protein ComEA